MSCFNMILNILLPLKKNHKIIVMRLIVIAFLFVGSLVSSPLSAQKISREGQHTSDENEPRNLIGVFVGNTSIVQSRFNLPTIGIEYVREINHNFGIGVISEFEIGSHIIQKNEEGDVVSEVERESAFLILPTTFIRVYNNLIFTAGYGIEFEKGKNLGLLKLGFEYVLYLKDPKWRVLPSVSWDHTKYFDGVVYGVTFGYTF